MFQHFQRGCRESNKNRNVKQNVQIKESYYIRKLKNEQKLIFESITQNTLIFQKTVINDRMFSLSEI